MTEHRYLYFTPELTTAGYLVDERLAALTERHKIDLRNGELMPVEPSAGGDALPRSRFLRLTRPYARLDSVLADTAGVVFELHRGWLGPHHFLLAARVLPRRERADA